MMFRILFVVAPVLGMNATAPLGMLFQPLGALKDALLGPKNAQGFLADKERKSEQIAMQIAEGSRNAGDKSLALAKVSVQALNQTLDWPFAVIDGFIPNPNERATQAASDNALQDVDALRLSNTLLRTLLQILRFPVNLIISPATALLEAADNAAPASTPPPTSTGQARLLREDKIAPVEEVSAEMADLTVEIRNDLRKKVWESWNKHFVEALEHNTGKDYSDLAFSREE